LPAVATTLAAARSPLCRARPVENANRPITATNRRI